MNAAVSLEFQDASALPDIPTGTMVCCILLTKAVTGRDWTVPAYYLNAYPLEMEEGCGADNCEEDHYDGGCSVTGWFYDESNFEYENCYHRVTGTVVAWARIPSAETVLAASVPS